MELWGTLSSRPVRWPRDHSSLKHFDAVRCILKGDLLDLLGRRDAFIYNAFARLQESGTRVYLDMPGDRMAVADTTASTDLYRQSSVQLIDANQRSRAGCLRVRGLLKCVGSIHVGARVSIADGAVSGEVLALSKQSVTVKLAGHDKLDLKSRSVAITGVAPCFASPTEDELAKIRSLVAWDLPCSGIIVSFAESRKQVDEVRESLQGALEVIPKIETLLGVSNAESIAANSKYCLIGRSDLLIETGTPTFVESVTRAVVGARRVDAKVIIGSGVAESLLRRAELDVADLSDLAYARHVRAAGVMVSGSVSELRLGEAGRALSYLKSPHSRTT